MQFKVGETVRRTKNVYGESRSHVGHLAVINAFREPFYYISCECGEQRTRGDGLGEAYFKSCTPEPRREEGAFHVGQRVRYKLDSTLLGTVIAIHDASCGKYHHGPCGLVNWDNGWIECHDTMARAWVPVETTTTAGNAEVGRAQEQIKILNDAIIGRAKAARGNGGVVAAPAPPAPKPKPPKSETHHEDGRPRSDGGPESDDPLEKRVRWMRTSSAMAVYDALDWPACAWCAYLWRTRRRDCQTHKALAARRGK